jgi:hypothetical protein
MSSLDEDVDASQVRMFLRGSLCMLTRQQPFIYIPCDESAMGAKHPRPTSHVLNPYISGPDTGDDVDQLLAEEYSPFDERDLPGGYAARFKLYRAAWKKCLARIEVRIDLFVFRPLLLKRGIQRIISSLHAPVVDEIVRSVHQAYDDVLPGLPYAELPVIAVSGASFAAWQGTLK